MNLELVTITGADDDTDIEEMVEISKEFPFVEWGILLSHSRIGTPRYPGIQWVKDLSVAASSGNIGISVHVCGKWAQGFVSSGVLNVPQMNLLFPVLQRIQLNVAWGLAQPPWDKVARGTFQGTPLIIQGRGTEVDMWDLVAMRSAGLRPQCLFDNSGGKGVRHEFFYSPHRGFRCGYAGGLNPENVKEALRKLYGVVPLGYGTWIDMESGVRTDERLRHGKGAFGINSSARIQRRLWLVSHMSHNAPLQLLIPAYL